MFQLGVETYATIVGKLESSFDIVRCSSVLYHLPNHMLMLNILRTITKEYLVLTSAITQEVIENKSGRYELPLSSVSFVPALSETERLCLKTHWERNGVVAYGITNLTTFSYNGTLVVVAYSSIFQSNVPICGFSSS
ncbi:hypothetical protein [Roseiflexus sp.]|uniref:hypothetical protein n=1 Tax=Roseiflexus sp. TaxID=2562120 RepID=UPI00398B1745